MTSRGRRLAVAGALVGGSCAGIPAWAAAPGPHVPTTPTGCTVVSTGARASCSFVASDIYGQQAMVVGHPNWSVRVARHHHTLVFQGNPDGACFGGPGSIVPVESCGLPLQAGDRVTVVLLSAGAARVGDDVCAEDPLCMP